MNESYLPGQPVPKGGTIRCLKHTEVHKVVRGGLFPDGRGKTCIWEYEKTSSTTINVLKYVATFIVGAIATQILDVKFAGMLPFGSTVSVFVHPVEATGGNAKNCVGYWVTILHRGSVGNMNFQLVFPAGIVAYKFGALEQFVHNGHLFWRGAGEVGSGCKIKQLNKFALYPNLQANQTGAAIVTVQAQSLPANVQLGGVVTIPRLPNSSNLAPSHAGTYEYSMLGQIVPKNIMFVDQALSMEKPYKAPGKSRPPSP